MKQEGRADCIRCGAHVDEPPEMVEVRIKLYAKLGQPVRPAKICCKCLWASLDRLGVDDE